MTIADLAFWILFSGLLLASCIIALAQKKIIGLFRVWKFLKSQNTQIRLRREKSTSNEECLAIEEILITCSRYRNQNKYFQEHFRFLPDSLDLISRIAKIYYPNEKDPMATARVGNVLSSFLDINRQVLKMMEIPGLETLTQFRLREVLPGFEKSDTEPVLVPGFILFRLRRMVTHILWSQWLLLVGEAAIRVYGRQRGDETLEPEVLLEEMDQLREEEDLVLPDEVRSIVETSKKNIMLSVKPLPYKEVESLYISLVNNIARFWHPQSSTPLYEVTVYDLLKSLTGYLEWAGRLSEKPVLNKMLGLKISYLTGVKEAAIPFSDNKLFEWVKMYQVGRAAKWAKTIFKTLKKKQPGILFRDVAFSIVKEGGKRWLMIYLHDKIAVETNKLYRT